MPCVLHQTHSRFFFLDGFWCLYCTVGFLVRGFAFRRSYLSTQTVEYILVSLSPTCVNAH